jgi:GNAT superfamily N-acetyltransferase
MARNVTVRVASASEYPRIRELYAAWGYRGGVLPQDMVYVAEQGSEVMAAVRRTHEHGFVLLRGMYVAPEHQRRGIGSQLLGFFVSHLDRAACYCVPYMHLREFYGRAGFAPLACESVPAFLRERVASYRARGLEVLVMHRHGHSTATERANPAMQPTARRRTPKFPITRTSHPPATRAPASGG